MIQYVPSRLNDKTFENFVIEVAKRTKTKKESAYFLEHGKESNTNE